MKTLIVFYSRYGNTAMLADAIARGAEEVEGNEVIMRRVDDLAPESVINNHHRWSESRQKLKAKYPEPTMDDLAGADAIIFGTPTRYGNMTAEMKLLIDKTGGLWAQSKLVNKVASVFTSTSTPHGGSETTCYTFLAPLIHMGMIIVTPGYAAPIMFEEGTPYGATAITGANSVEHPTEKNLEVARFQGRRVAEITNALLKGGLKKSH